MPGRVLVSLLSSFCELCDVSRPFEMLLLPFDIKLVWYRRTVLVSRVYFGELRFIDRLY